MIREVDLVSYLPPFLADYKETNMSLSAENPEFNLVWEAADRTLKNEFIETADEYGISRFEKLLSIIPSDNDTLENRRARIQFKWFTMLPYTWRMLMQKLIALCGENNFSVTKKFDFYRIDLEARLELFGQAEELDRIMETLVPYNMVINAKNGIFIKTEGTALVSGSVHVANLYMITNDWKEEKTIEGIALIGTGIVETQNRMITNDWKENVPVKGFAVNGANILNTASITITEAFKEHSAIHGNYTAGFGISATEYIEIS